MTGPALPFPKQFLMRQLGTVALDLLRSCLVYAMACWIAFAIGLALSAAFPPAPELPPGTESYLTWGSHGWEAIDWELRNWSYGFPFLGLGVILGAMTHLAVRLAEWSATVRLVPALVGGVVGAGLPLAVLLLLRQDILIAGLVIALCTVAGATVGSLFMPRHRSTSRRPAE